MAAPRRCCAVPWAACDHPSKIDDSPPLRVVAFWYTHLAFGAAMASKICAARLRHTAIADVSGQYGKTQRDLQGRSAPANRGCMDAASGRKPAATLSRRDR